MDLVTNSQLSPYSHTLKRFVRTSEGMCSRSSLRGKEEKQDKWSSDRQPALTLSDQVWGLSLSHHRDS